MFLWAILDVVVDRYFVATDAIDNFLDGIETVVFDEEPRAIPREIFAMRRALITFRRAAAPLREVMSQILRREVPSVSDTAIVHMQDVYDHVLRVLDLIESQRELLTGLLEGQLAVMSNRMNQVMKATSSWGAILIVATLIAGIYGMNFQHMPELEWYYGYPFALGVMALSMYVLYRVFKRRGWL
jgi:magnesium transporter